MTVVGPDGRPRCSWATSAPEYIQYHDEEWGREIRDDHGLFERMTLEGFQSGLSWITILRRREGFRLWSFQPVDRPAPKTNADVPATTPESVAMSKALKKKGFVFVGPTTAYALMQATGIVNDHLAACIAR